MREIDVAGHRVLCDAHLAPPVHAACRDALSRPGHLFSPSPTWARLFLAWVDALAPERRDALLPAAVACECMAAGYDLIDAVSDHAGATGMDTALNHDLPIGVTLLLLAQETLAALDPPGARAAALLARAGRRALAGQIQDQELRRQPTATQDAALDVLRRRSGTLVAAPCQCAAVLAGAPWRVVALAGRFGAALGCATQLEDDLADRVDDARGGRQTIPTILMRLYPDDPDLADATAWVLMQRFLAEAARVLIRLSLYIDTEPLWTLLPAELRAA